MLGGGGQVVQGLKGFLLRVSAAEAVPRPPQNTDASGRDGVLCGYRCNWVPRELTHILAGPGPSSIGVAESGGSKAETSERCCPPFFSPPCSHSQQRRCLDTLPSQPSNVTAAQGCGDGLACVMPPACVVVLSGLSGLHQAAVD